MRDGLPGQEITSLAQTPDGYVWLGTMQGMLRFDGISFTRFDSSNVDGLVNDTIHSLTVGRDGTLYIGPEWCGFGALHERKFLRANFRNSKWNAVRCLHQSPNGDLWVGYQGWNYCLLHEHNDVVRRVAVSGTFASGMVDESDGSVLVSALDGGIFRIAPTGAVTAYATRPAIPTNDFTCIAKTPDGSVWCGSNSSGLYRVRGTKWARYTTANGLTSDTVRCLYTDHAGQLWIGTSDGIDWLDGNRIDHFGTADGLPSGDIADIVEDHEQNLWIAAGIYLVRFANNPLVSIEPRHEMTNVFSVSAAPSGSVYCSAVDGLWQVWGNGAYRRCLPGNIAYGIGATSRHGLIVIERQNSQSYLVKALDGRSVPPLNVHFTPLTVLETRNGVVLFGNRGEFRRYPNDSSVHYLIPRSYGAVQVYDIKPAPKGTLWLATDLGLVHYANGHIKVVDCGLGAGTHVLTIDSSDPRHIWLGSDYGLTRGDLVQPIDRAQDVPSCYHFTDYSSRDGLPAGGVFQVLPDGRGSVWAGGYFGIFSVRTDDLSTFDHHLARSIPARLYSAADGIRSYPGVSIPVRASNGTLCFVGSKGLTFIDPQHIKNNSLPPPVAIEDIVANGVSLDGAGRHPVRPGVGSLLIHYAALSYIVPEKLRFRYRLEGFDKSWVDAGDRRIAAYTNLPPGHYVFHVIACNDDGVWNTTGASAVLDFKPHFYETGWFRGGVAALCLFAMALIVALRTNAIATHARRLEAEVARRTLDLSRANERLTAMHDDLTSNVEQLQASQAEIEAQRDELAEITFQLETQNRELFETREYLAQANERLEGLALTDGLTGLNNRRSYVEKLNEEWARYQRYGTPLSVVLVDIDHFKQFNDTFGHLAGDDVLRTVADILKSSARASDFVARYGGEEFVVIACESDAVSAQALAERLRAAVESHHWTQRQISGSFGVATATPIITADAMLVHLADKALYLSKRNGRNRVTHARDMAAVESLPE